MNITEAEIDKLKASKNEQAWNAVCDEIKKARAGQYPPDWWAKVMQSGLAANIQDSWSRIVSASTDAFAGIPNVKHITLTPPRG